MNPERLTTVRPEDKQLSDEQENLRVAEEDLADKCDALSRLKGEMEIESSRYKALFDYAPDAYLLTDGSGVIEEANRAASDLLHMSPELLRGRSMTSFVAAADLSRFLTYLNRLRSDPSRQEWELRLTGRNSDAIIAICTISPALDDDGEPAFLRWLIRDVTAQKKAEATSAQLAAIVRASQDGIIGCDTAGIIQSWNRGAEHILGFAEEEAIGKFLPLLVLPGATKERTRFVKMILQGVALTEWEATPVRKDGSKVPIALALSSSRTKAGELLGFTAIVRDVTARKHAEAEQTRQRAKIAEEGRRLAVLQERNRMAQEIHDGLGQTLLGINLHAEAARDVVQEPNELLRCLDRIQEFARTGLAEARRSVMALRPGLLEDHTLREALAFMADQTAIGSRAQIVQEITAPPHPLPVAIEADLFRIAQEALTNAVLHSDARHIRLGLHQANRHVSLEVEDDGCGFDVEAPSDRLGLRGIRERIARLGGELDLVSRPGEGTLLRVTVPTSEKPAKAPWP